MISGIGWVSELIEIAGGVDVFPLLAARKSAKERIVSGDAGDRRRARHCYRLLVRQEIRAGEIRGAAGIRAIPAVRDGFLRESNRALILQPGPAALTDGLDAIEAIIDQWAEAQRVVGNRERLAAR